MTTPRDASGLLPTSAELAWAERHAPLGGYLIGLLIRVFEVPEQDAERLVRETFYDYRLTQPALNARAASMTPATPTASSAAPGRTVAPSAEGGPMP